MIDWAGHESLFLRTFQYILLFCSSIVLFDISSIILLGFRYSASSTPIISSVGVAIGAGSTPSISIYAICRNPIIPNVLIRWALIGSPPVEVSGSIGTVYSFLVLYALLFLISCSGQCIYRFSLYYCSIFFL